MGFFLDGRFSRVSRFFPFARTAFLSSYGTSLFSSSFSPTDEQQLWRIVQMRARDDSRPGEVS
jgi:hypothetical protein